MAPFTASLDEFVITSFTIVRSDAARVDPGEAPRRTRPRHQRAATLVPTGTINAGMISYRASRIRLSAVRRGRNGLRPRGDARVASGHLSWPRTRSLPARRAAAAAGSSEDARALVVAQA